LRCPVVLVCHWRPKSRCLRESLGFSTKTPLNPSVDSGTISYLHRFSYANSSLPLHHTIFPHRVTSQRVKFLHVHSIALKRVAPKLFPGEPKVPEGVIDRIRNLTALADPEGDPVFCFPIYDLLTTTHIYLFLFCCLLNNWPQLFSAQTSNPFAPKVSHLHAYLSLT
jgi:hypothetical protein